MTHSIDRQLRDAIEDHRKHAKDVALQMARQQIAELQEALALIKAPLEAKIIEQQKEIETLIGQIRG